MISVLFIFGTRPEAIKLCPVIHCLRRNGSEFDVKVCVTGQHREMLDQVLRAFVIKPDYDLNVMAQRQTLCQSTSRIVAALDTVLTEARPNVVLVQGDTTTTLCGAIAAFYHGVEVGHVEAGLRTGDLRKPFPEEMNRVLVSRLATLHFAATEGAARNLALEGISPQVVTVTGNTGVDTILHVKDQLERGRLTGLRGLRLDHSKRLLLVTAHRRESFGAGIEGICAALVRLAERPDIQIVYPVHPNPNVTSVVTRRLSSCPNLLLLKPLDYVPFVDLMRHARIVLTDSGGIQEECPSLGKPVLVLRDQTERPEALDAGTMKLVGTNPDRIVAETTALLDDESVYRRMARSHDAYGDGHASDRIALVLRAALADKQLHASEAATRAAPLNIPDRVAD